MDKWCTARIIWIKHWTPTLLSFRIARPEGYCFTPGHYARLGLADGSDEAVWRPFSMVSAVEDDFLEFIVVLVPGGKFSEQLRSKKVGEDLMVEKLSRGFLTLDQLAPGEDIWMLASGSGIGPFLSILKEAKTWKSFGRLILVHSVRHREDLAYRDEIETRRAVWSGNDGNGTLSYIPVVTREAYPGALQARITQLAIDGQLECAGETAIGVDHSRVMVCGNPELTRDMRGFLAARGFQTSRRGVPGQMAFEKYW